LIVAVVAAGVWIAMKPRPAAAPPPAVATPTQPPAAPPRAVEPPPRAVEPPPPRAAEPPPPQTAPADGRLPAAQPGTASPGGESYELVVASFRTEARANDVARQIEAMGQKVRQRSLGGWQQVLVGPYASREAAGEAQQQLQRAGFGEAVIVRENR
jgi:cell division protein FtsN